MNSHVGVPIGTIIMWGGTDDTPGGWLLCDGSPASIKEYPELGQVLGATFGTGPTGKFLLPDLRGRFVRGVDSTPQGSRDPDRDDRTDPITDDKVGPKVGSLQADELASHTHSYTQFPNGSGNMASGRYWDAQTADTGSTGGNETRPKNMYLNFLIKAA